MLRLVITSGAHDSVAQCVSIVSLVRRRSRALAHCYQYYCHLLPFCRYKSCCDAVATAAAKAKHVKLLGVLFSLSFVPLPILTLFRLSFSFSLCVSSAHAAVANCVEGHFCPIR